MRLLVALCSAVFLFQTAPVSAQVIGDPDVIKLLMADFGLPATKTTDSDGDPMLDSRIDGTHFSVYFYNCKANRCGSVQFSAGFDMDEPMTYERVNEWNKTTRYGKVYLDEEMDPYVEMDIGLAGEGIGSKNFDDALDTWRVVLSDFRKFIDW